MACVGATSLFTFTSSQLCKLCSGILRMDGSDWCGRKLLQPIDLSVYSLRILKDQVRLSTSFRAGWVAQSV